MMDFAHKLRTMRAARNLTQVRLGELAMTSQWLISYIEVGQMLPSPDLEKRLRKALDWTELEDRVFEILGREKETET